MDGSWDVIIVIRTPQ